MNLRASREFALSANSQACLRLASGARGFLPRMIETAQANERCRANETDITFDRRGYADASAPAHEVGRLRERDG
jgi:hypothetical protein